MILRRLVLILACLAAPLAASEEVVLGLSQDEVSISTDFDGSDVLIYGAVKRDSPAPEAPPLAVIITVSGPHVPLTVYRKERVMGIWANTHAVGIDSAPSFYAVASSVPLDQALSAVEDLRRSISIRRAIRAVGAPDDVADAAAFTEALIRIRESDALYRQIDRAVDLRGDTLFSTSVRLPANLTEGRYEIRVYLTRGGQVVGQIESGIDVRKVGLERWLWNLSQSFPLLYGLMCVALALAAGWLASAATALLRD